MTYGANTQTVDGILKDFAADYIVEGVNLKNPLRDFFKFDKETFAGRKVIHPSHVGTNESPMWVNEDGAFAEAGNQSHVQPEITQRKIMGRIRLTAEAMWDTTSTKGAWKSARRDEMDGLIDNMARREEHALNGDGRGILAYIASADPDLTTTVEVDNPGGISSSNFGNRFIQRNMWLAAVDPATGNLRSGGARKVVACNSDGSDIEFNTVAPTTWADNDYLVQAANSSVTDIIDTSYEAQAWGLVALIDDGTYRENYFALDRSNVQNEYASAYVKAATGALSHDVMQQTADIMDQRLGGRVDTLIMHHSVRRQFINITQGDRRYGDANSRNNPDAGTAAFLQDDLTFGKVALKAMRDFPLDQLMMLDKANSGFVCYESEPGAWVEDGDGRILVRVGTGSTARHAFEAWYVRRAQYYCKKPALNARLDGITGLSLVVVRPVGY